MGYLERDRFEKRVWLVVSTLVLGGQIGTRGYVGVGMDGMGVEVEVDLRAPA